MRFKVEVQVHEDLNEKVNDQSRVTGVTGVPSSPAWSWRLPSGGPCSGGPGWDSRVQRTEAVIGQKAQMQRCSLVSHTSWWR